MASAEFTIAAEADDCMVYQVIATSTWTFTTDWAGFNWLWAGYASGAAYKKCGVGLRFQNVTIPANARITNAYLKLKCAQASTVATMRTRICGEKQLTPAAFSTVADYQSRRGTDCAGANNNLRTYAQVDWDEYSNPTLGNWVLDTTYNSPDISNVIQEIILQPGWVSGNSIVLFWDDHVARGTQSGNCYRAIWSYAKTTPAILHIDYEYSYSPPSMVWATLTGATQSIPNTTWTKCAFNVLYFDLKTEYDTTNYRFVAKQKGYYWAFGQTCILEVPAGKGSFNAIYKNGSRYATSGQYTPDVVSPKSNTPPLNDIVYLDVDEYIEWWVYHNFGSTTTIGGYEHLAHWGISSVEGLLRVHLSADQTITASTWTKIAFDTEEFDLEESFDPVTNYRFTPTRTGYYAVIIGVASVDSFEASKRLATAIYKNGVINSQVTITSSDTDVNEAHTNCSDVLYMNGSTDYIEAWVYHDNAANRKIDANSYNTWMSIARVF